MSRMLLKLIFNFMALIDVLNVEWIINKIELNKVFMFNNKSNLLEMNMLFLMERNFLWFEYWNPVANMEI